MSEPFGVENEVKAWLAFAAMKAAAEILAITASAPAYVQKVIASPFQVDLAIVARLADLLSPPEIRMAPADANTSFSI